MARPAHELIRQRDRKSPFLLRQTGVACLQRVQKSRGRPRLLRECLRLRRAPTPPKVGASLFTTRSTLPEACVLRHATMSALLESSRLGWRGGKESLNQISKGTDFAVGRLSGPVGNRKAARESANEGCPVADRHAHVFADILNMISIRERPVEIKDRARREAKRPA